MKRVLARAICLNLMLVAAPVVGVAQAGGETFVGETLAYEAKVDKVLRGISVADLTFIAARGNDPDELKITSKAVSKGTLLKLFRFNFLQEYDSFVDLRGFRILRTVKHDVQKQRVRDSEAFFDYGQHLVTFVETDPREPMRAPRRIASEIGDRLNDMISAIYAMRLTSLSVGQRLVLKVSDSGLIYNVPFAVAAREIQKTILGKVVCFRVEPDIFGPGRLIERKGKMVIWMTADARHIPVRARLDTEFGKVNVKLKSYTKAPLGTTLPNL